MEEIALSESDIIPEWDEQGLLVDDNDEPDDAGVDHEEPLDLDLDEDPEAT